MFDCLRVLEYAKIRTVLQSTETFSRLALTASLQNYQGLDKKKASGTQGISDADKLAMFESDVSETSYVIALQIKSIRDQLATSLKKK